jgi:hypothetical protein
VNADENYGNLPPDPNMMMNMEAQESINLPFDPNYYTFLVYNPGGQSSIVAAMAILKIPYDLRGPGNEVTPNDLATHDILIVGSNFGGDTTGLDANTLLAGITGRVILTGHDADWHFVNGSTPQSKLAAQTFLVNAINYVLAGGGTGLIAFVDAGSTHFPYLPDAWDISATVIGTGEIINEFTPEALASGVYDDLDPCDMSNWYGTYHDIFTIEPGSSFVEFELGGNTGNDIITVALAKGTVSLTKTVEIVGECVCPDDYITYYIEFGNSLTNSVYDINIIDHLPVEVNFVSASDGGSYDSQTHSVYWNLDALDPNCEFVYEITVQLNRHAIPMSQINNFAEIIADEYYGCFASATVEVCNWGGGIVYVDNDANGLKNGTSWDDAYSELRDGLTEAQRLGENLIAIWVAAGTYKPVYDMNSGYQSKRFNLLNNLALIGHFGGIGTYETSPDQRNLADANNTTILEGRVGTTQSQAVQNVVYANGITNALVDGFTVCNSYNGAGIYLYDADVSIVNCRLEKNHSYGISANNYSYPGIHNCTFFNNTTAGCYSSSHCQPEISYSVFDGNNVNGTQGLSMSFNCAVTVTNSVFKNNKYYGIYGIGNGNLSATDSQFTNNYYGLYLSDITTTFLNSEIESSTYYGFYCTGSNVTIDNSSIKNSTNNGLYCSSSNVAIDYSSIKNSKSSGINAGNSDITVSHCLLDRNGDNGIYISNGCNLSVQNSIVRDSNGHGLELNDDTTTTVKNSWIHNNGTQHYSPYGGAGIYLANTTQTPLIRNVTIYDNWTYGIQANQYGPDPNVLNCILYGNDSNDFYRTSGSFSTVNYCCLQNTHSSGIGNFVADPLFTLSDDNDLHIDEDSPCVNAGDPCGVYVNEKDIDDENRIYYGRVDVGADEYYWSPADYDKDGIVNFADYAAFAHAWRTNDANISLDGDNDVDIDDLVLFCADWLWQKQPELGWMQGMRAMSQGGSSEMDTMVMMAATDSESMTTDVPTAASNSLRLTDVQTSKALRPKRLTRKTDAFYAITVESVAAWKAKTAAPENSLMASQADDAVMTAESEAVDVNELADWLEKIWLEDAEIRATNTPEEWQQFIDLLRSGQ